ncbi:hypothetical protein LEP1GSC125_1971 [Leptospira mayottensis 200901122]|uniref:Uncharacterized protein n=1 Tax=Leptospira mayottensis 200901122 TaxID=1193010 RepID=A0AA87SV22_9LEPT|nr:hypothetical protein LEP1GSC125_1971 [Leptospira mayottensis 200901122]
MSQNFDGNIIANFSQNEGVPTDWLFIGFQIDSIVVTFLLEFLYS